MLERLSITNFALIRKAGLEFKPGFTVITGETGAGKSLIVGALTSLAGARAPFGVVSDSGRSAVIEGEFLRNGQVVILRRQISTDGRSRAFIDDEPVNQKDFASASSSFLDITSQRAFNRLLDPELHLEFYDEFLELSESRKKLASFATVHNNLLAEVKRLVRARDDHQIRREYLSRQLDEIDRLDPKENEDVELSAEVRRLESFEQIARDGARIVELLAEGAESVIGRAVEVEKLIEGIAKLDTSLNDLPEEMRSISVTLTEIARRVGERSNPDSDSLGQLDLIRERLHNLVALGRRYGGSIGMVLERAKEFRSELAKGTDIETEISAKTYELERLRKEWQNLAGEISAWRFKGADRFRKEITNVLKSLGFDAPDFKVLISAKLPAFDELTGRGTESVEFAFSANPGMEPRPLHSIASGGELSRILLALKEITPLQSDEVTVIFDEIDTGISGKTASLVGHRLKAIANGRQLIAITHLPQIAALADWHLQVTKTSSDGTTGTEIEYISGDYRRNAIASMLSDGNLNPSALEQAERLLKTTGQ